MIRSDKRWLYGVGALAVAGVIASVALAQAPAPAPASDPLVAGFTTPPSTVYPSGSITWSTNAETVRAGLTRQKAIGAHYVSGGSNGPPGAYMSDAWKQSVSTAAKVALEMGFEANFLTSPGFSQSGDSLVKPEEAMKKLVWSVTPVKGGAAFNGKLAAPPNNSGPYQNVPYFSETPWTLAKDQEFYRDVAVLAYRVPNRQAPLPAPTITSSEGAVDPAKVSGADPRNPLVLDSTKAAPWIQIDYPTPQAVRSFTLGTPEVRFQGSMLADLSAKQADGSYRKIATFNMRSTGQLTITLPPVRSASFRLAISRLPEDVEPQVPYSKADDLGGGGGGGGGGGRGAGAAAAGAAGAAAGGGRGAGAAAAGAAGAAAGGGRGAGAPGGAGAAGAGAAGGGGGGNPFALKRPPAQFAISTVKLSADGGVNAVEQKAGYFTFVRDYYALNTNPEAVTSITSKTDVIDISKNMKPDGSLTWRAPAGNWEILRFGYSLTGKVNHPAPADATGLEVDKMSPTHMRDYYARYLDAFMPKGEERKAITAIFSDSIESSPQNWTEDMVAEFKKRAGYDPTPYLPALTGVVIESPAATDKFLWDFRETISQLSSEVTYGIMTEEAHKRGLQTRVQALEQNRHQLGDDFDMRRYADMPMGALWGSEPLVDYLKEFPNQVADQKGAASIAHIYGRPVVGAESGTTLSFPGAFSPRITKQLVDIEFAIGINWLTRGAPSPNDLWAAYGDDWLKYIARSSYLLQQGRYVADVAFYYGEDAPLVTQRDRLFAAPLENASDYINTNALLDASSVKGGKLTTTGGMEYRVLQLGGSSNYLTVKVLKKLAEFAQAGLVIAGPAPVDTPSLADDPAEFQRLKTQLWGADGRGAKLGQGQVIGTGAIAQALASVGVTPDLTAQGWKVGDEVLFVHRTLGAGGDFYFVMNRTGRAGPIELSFRQTGRTPELWRADTGERTPLSFRTENGRTIVPVNFAPNDAMFVMFRGAAQAPSLALPAPKQQVIARLDDAWQVAFAADRGGPAQPVALPIGSWTTAAEPGVKYYSGTATYTRTVNVPGSALGKGSKVILDLGEVQDLANVSVNGTNVGVRWTPPYKYDLTSALKPGKNTIEIKVINRPINRMIGDAQPGATRINRGGGGYKPTAPLRPSGIIGPVALIRERQ